MDSTEGFYWERHPEIEAVFLNYLDIYRRENSFIADFENNLALNTSSRMIDWIDHILVRNSGEMREKLNVLGFRRQENTKPQVFYHPGVLLPAVVLVENSTVNDPGIALRVESIESFIQANNLTASVEGPAFSPYRRACVNRQSGTALWVVERRGTQAFDPVFPEDQYFQNYTRGIESWKNIHRYGEDGKKVLGEMKRIARDLTASLGEGLAAHVVLLCEREYWMARNSAGRVQKKRQDALGMGWANHDHHTFRSSRRHFSELIALFLLLGFQKRERFYAGAEAGWGAQVMEHPTAQLSLFLDVDLSPEETDIDFSTRKLGDLKTLGTVGLWCALHGDSILKAGMHHLAARFDFERLMEDGKKHDIRFMAPFSNFPYLKQAFSIPEMWQVDPSGIRELLKNRHISEEQSEKFLAAGSVGSHLENIERREGYKGFNRKNVSAIIRDTDPRRT